MESNYISHMWKFAGDSHLDVILTCQDGSASDAYFEEIIRSVIHDVAKEYELYLIIMPDYSVEDLKT